MKIIAFEVRDDEKEYFEKYAAEYKCEITCVSEMLSYDNISMTKGYDGVSTLGKSNITADLEDRLKELGVICCGWI